MSLFEKLLNTKQDLQEGFYHCADTKRTMVRMVINNQVEVESLKAKHLAEDLFYMMNYHYVVFKPTGKREVSWAQYDPNKDWHRTYVIECLTRVATLFPSASAIKRMPFGREVENAVLTQYAVQHTAGKDHVKHMEQSAKEHGVPPIKPEKVASPGDAEPTPENIQMAESIMNAAKERVKDSVPPNIPLAEELLNAFQEADVGLYDTTAREFMARMKHGFTKEDAINFKNVEELLTQRAEAQIFESLRTDPNTKEELAHNHFAQSPTLSRNRLPTAADFGRMPPRQKLKLLYSKSSAMDMLTKLLYSGHKVVFNKNLLTEKGALRYAKQIGGTFAPIKDYDGDGMPDFLIYDKNGKIAAINGHRLKRDDKHALKRLFYQMVPDPKQQKAMGGFQGWLHTELFQVGPYDWKGERSVRVTESNYNLLQALHQRGYLSKKPESYIPRSKKSFSSTVKTHFADSIKFGLESFFDSHNKALWYLPLNYIRDTIYKVVVGSEMYRIAQERGYDGNILNQINVWNKNKAAMKRRDQAKPAMANQVYKLLSEWINNDEGAKASLQSLLGPIVKDVVPLVHYIAAYLVITQSSFPQYTEQGTPDTIMNQDPSKATAAKATLAELKKVWAGQLRKACEGMLNEYFGKVTGGKFVEFVQTFQQQIPNYQVPPYQVNATEYPVMAKKDTKYAQWSDPKYAHWNQREDEESAPPWEFMTEPIKRTQKARPWNQHLLEGQAYGNAVIDAEQSVWGKSPFSNRWKPASAYKAAN